MPSVWEIVIPRSNREIWCDIFFFNDKATTEIYTLSLHDALPICRRHVDVALGRILRDGRQHPYHHVRAVIHLKDTADDVDRKSTRLNSSHANITYSVLCLKKKINEAVEMDLLIPI